MAKKVQLKTSKNDANVEQFIASVEPESLRDDAMTLLKFFQQVTGMEAKMWGKSFKTKKSI